MAQNLVHPNKDNKVVFIFGGVDLTLATNLIITFGAESYQLSDNEVTVTSATELTLDLSATNEVGKLFATVTYFDAGSVNGTDITSQALGNAEKIVIAIGSQLIIEDGSVVADANSYVTDAEYLAWASLHDYNVQATEADRDSSAAKAYALLVSNFESMLSGSRVSVDQTGALPRIGMNDGSFDIASGSIPRDFKVAQMMLMTNIGDGATTNSFVAGSTGSSGGALSSFEVVGAYKETYQAGTTATSNVLASFPAVNKLLARYGADSGSLVRV